MTELAGDMLLAELKQGRGDADYSSVAQRYFPAPPKVVRPEAEKAMEKSEPPQPTPEIKEAPPKPAEPPPLETKLVELTTEREEKKDEAIKEEKKEEELLEGVNLSGGFRGWLSRRFSKSTPRP